MEICRIWQMDMGLYRGLAKREMFVNKRYVSYNNVWVHAYTNMLIIYLPNIDQFICQ